MATTNDCPDPALGEALAPYLRSRAEVSEVREKLQTYLEKQLKLEDKSLSITTLTTPPCTATLTEAPEALSGVRKAYWNALRAHQQAQAKYRQLKADIQELSKQPTLLAVQHGTSDVQEDILPLLRQREKQRKLGVITQALASITSDETAPSGIVIDDYVKVRAGEMPLLPNLDSVQHGYVEEADTRMLELKKAILTAKNSIDSHQDAPMPPMDKQTELYALQQTRNMLIEWIESQLTVIGEAQAANEKPIDSLAVEGDAPIPVTQDEIKQIYSQYLLARRKLLQALQHPQKHEFDALEQLNDRVSAKAKVADTSDAMAATILPYVEPLLAMQSHQDALSQQMTASRRQLDSSDAETKQLLRRLAHESHLVVPGASSGREWEQASLRANAGTSEHVKSKAAAGLKAAKTVDELLGQIDTLSASIGVAEA